MSVLRSLNVLNQMRVDVPHLRLLESGVAGDFDTVVGRILSGAKPLIYKGFVVSGQGGAANDLVVNVAGGIAANLNGSASGSFIYVPADRTSEVLNAVTNSRVEGSFVASATNYIGIDFVREVDESTADVVVFKNPTTGTETSRTVPLAKVMDYRIVVSTTPFSANANIIPIAKAVTDASNTVTSLVDARNLAFRLGVGGDFPSSASTYAWPQGRTEGSFSGGDKSITSFKEWSEAIMARLWEVGGGSSWFSPAADRNVEFTNYGTPNPANGEYFTFNSGTGAVTWQGIRFLFDGEAATFNEVEPDSGTILDGECIYVDLDRTTDRVEGVNGLVAQIGDLTNLGVGDVPGSRWVMAWRVGTSLYTRNWRYPVGTIFQPATTGALGVVLLNETPASALTPAVVAIRSGGGIRVVATSGVGAEIRGFNNSGLNAYTNASTPDGFAAINGIGLGTNNAGVWGVGTGTEPGVRGEAGASGSPGVLGISGGGTGAGVRGESTAANGRSVVGYATGATAKGVYGEATNATGVGVYGTSPILGTFGEATGALGRGVQGVASGSAICGVEGIANVTDGIGVAGKGTLQGVYGEGTGANATGVVGVGTGTGFGVASLTGPVGAPAASNFKYTGTKTGVLIIPASDLQLAGPFSSGSSGALTNNGLSPNVADGTMNAPHWRQGAVGVSERLVGKINLPRGATITGVELWIENNTGPAVGPGGTLLVKHHTYAGAGTPTTVTVLNTTVVSIPNATNGWVATTSSPTASALESGTTGSNNSGWTTIEFQPPVPGGTFIRIGALRITYDYTTVDFMV